MSIRNSRFIGKYQRPESETASKRTVRVYSGTETHTGQIVRFTNSNGSPVIISAKEWPKWRKISDAG